MLHDVRVRVDAQRNRDRILEAARALVAETGVDATMEDIARYAGVAVGTLYRHFPAKEDLVAAVVEDSLAQMASLTEGALAAVHAGAPPGAAIGELFREIAERHATDQAFKSAAGRLDVNAEIAAASPGSPIARSVAAISELLQRAQIAAPGGAPACTAASAPSVSEAIWASESSTTAATTAGMASRNE